MEHKKIFDCNLSRWSQVYKAQVIIVTVGGEFVLFSELQLNGSLQQSTHSVSWEMYLGF